MKQTNERTNEQTNKQTNKQTKFLLDSNDFGFTCAGVSNVGGYKRNVWYNPSCLLHTCSLSTNEKLSVSWQFFETYGVTNYDSGWSMDLHNYVSAWAEGRMWWISGWSLGNQLQLAWCLGWCWRTLRPRVFHTECSVQTHCGHELVGCTLDKRKPEHHFPYHSRL